METLSFLLDTSMDSVLVGLKLASNGGAQLLMRPRSAADEISVRATGVKDLQGSSTELYKNTNNDLVLI